MLIGVIPDYRVVDRSGCVRIGPCLTVDKTSKYYQYPVQFSRRRSRGAAQVPRRTIVITGASDGVAAAAARRLAADGNEVVVVGRSPAKTKSIADELGVARVCGFFRPRAGSLSRA